MTPRFLRQSFLRPLSIHPALFAAAILLWGFGSQAQAGPTVRIALIQNADTVKLAAAGGLVLEGAALSSDRKEVMVTTGSQAILIDNRKISGTEIGASAKSGTLTVNGIKAWGTIRIRVVSGKLLVVNLLDVEDYLRGVVPMEVSVQWHPEVLKVQSIISRTYALFQAVSRRDKAFDLVATIQDQVYGGPSRWHAASDAAIAETAGLVLQHRGELVFAAYHSTSAGPTEDVREVWNFDFDYLRGVSCPFDATSPHFRWRRFIPIEKLQAALATNGRTVGVIASVTPYSWTASGRVSRVRILNSEGEVVIRAEELRKALGYTELPSANFTVSSFGRLIQFDGQGAGHGVGLCQWGAKQLAEMGYTAEEIVRYYYPGVTIGHADAFF